MTYAITLRHHFEAAHRLPHLDGKCKSLHGHTWGVAVRIEAPALTTAHTLTEFGGYKTRMRNWVDANLDHGSMLGIDDPVTDVLLNLGCKVFVFGVDWADAEWPTVEAVAEVIGMHAVDWLISTGADTATGARVTSCLVTETANNAAEWSPDR